jgi:photosystem II stability/assembly factor-like uncharacterized protein
MTARRLTITMAVTLLAAAARAAAPAPPDKAFTYGPWRHSAIGGGGYVQNVVLCPSDPQRAYAYVDNSGMFRSDDAGRTWRIIHGSLPASFGIYDVRGLVVDPRDANRIAAAIGGQWDHPWGIFVSADGGTTWKRTLTANFFGSDEYREAGFILDRNPRRPDELTAATGGTGVFRSDDRGQTWHKLGLEGVYPTDLRYDRSEPARLWLSAKPMKMRSGLYPTPMTGGFYRSKDGGATWKKLGDGSPTEILQDPVQAGRLYGIFDDTRIRTSTDGGENWSDLSAGLDLAPPGEHPQGNHPHRYSALAAGPDFVLTASGAGEFFRLNSARSAWQRVERQGIEENYLGQPWFASRACGVHGYFGSALGSITVDPRNPDRWFFTDFYAIYRTTDAGKHWALSCDGVDATVLWCLTQDPRDAGVTHLGMADNGFFISEDGGARFLRPNTGNTNAHCISVSRSQPTRLYATGSGLKGKLAWGKACQVYVSIDRGQTWTASPMLGLPPMAERVACTILADPREPYTAYLGLSGGTARDSGGVWRTVDGGRSWKWMGAGLPEKNWFFRTNVWNAGRELAVGPDGRLVAFGSAGVFRFSATEEKWLRAAKLPGGSPNEVVADPHHPGRFYLAAEGSGGGIFRSDDGGATWSSVLKGDSRHVAVDEAKAERLAAGLADGVVLSTDGGRTWTEADRRLPFRFHPLVAFAGERLLAGTVGNGCFWMPLSEAGARDVKAAPVPRAMQTAPSIAADWLEGWKSPPGVRWHREGPTTLVAESTGGRTESTITKMVAIPPDAAEQSLVVGGRIKTSGDLDTATLSIYCDGTWEGFVDAPATRDWMEFSRAAQLPPTARQARLQLTLKGNGKVWINDLRIVVARVWKEH